MNELAKIDSFSKEVAIAETIEEISQLTLKGEIMAEMAKKLDIPLQGQNKLGRTRIELTKKLRDVIKVKFPKGGDRKSKSEIRTLKNAGITKNASSDAKIIKDDEGEIDEVMNELEAQKEVITPKTVAKKLRVKKKKKQQQVKQEISNELDKNVSGENAEIDINKGWYKIGNQFLYYGSNLDVEFLKFLPKNISFAFADPPYNAGVADWDNNFKWKHDYLIDLAGIVAVTPGGWNAFNFYQETKMNYQWEMCCWIKNGMTHGRCGFSNFIKTSIFSNKKVKIEQDFWSITIKINETHETDHKGRKPYDFMIHLIDMFSNENDNIIDVFAGSGTTLLVSEKMNRVSYNAEISEDYIKEILNRCLLEGMKYEQL